MDEAQKQAGFWFNLNYQVTVILTEDGAHVVNHRYDKLNGMFPGAMTPSKIYAAGDQYEAQFWSLMQDFGEHIGVLKPTLFENNTVFFEADGIGTAEPPTPLPCEPCDDDEDE